MSPVICISGIDTDIGKSVATGMMARFLLSRGQSVITQKIVQTGCRGIAEDILTHRKLMGVELFPEDVSGLTCPFVFTKPCSPHLAAELEGKQIDPGKILADSGILAERYDYVLLEGVGGLMVPLTRNLTFLDYIEEQKYPLILVSGPRLGSVNHTLSALELLQKRGVAVRGIVYNCYGASDPDILRDSRMVFAEYLSRYGFPSRVIDLMEEEKYYKSDKLFDCSKFFEEYTEQDEK